MTAHGLVALVLAAAGALQPSPEPPSSSEIGAFGFVNQQGTNILGPAAVAQPELLKWALCSGGRNVPIRFAARQSATKADSGRRTAQNFGNSAGVRFTLSGTPLGKDEICLLTTDAVIATATVLPVRRSPANGATCTAPQQRRITSSRQRDVVRCARVASYGPDKDILLIEFGRRGADALASVVLLDAADPATPVYADFPAKYTGPGEDLWRADDEGVLRPDGFRPMALLRHHGSYLLALRWDGAEGEHLGLYRSAGERFTAVLSDYVYSAPR
jgi:hypothetical protein